MSQPSNIPLKGAAKNVLTLLAKWVFWYSLCSKYRDIQAHMHTHTHIVAFFFWVWSERLKCDVSLRGSLYFGNIRATVIWRYAWVSFSGESHKGSMLESQKREGVCACVVGGKEGCLQKFWRWGMGWTLILKAFTIDRALNTGSQSTPEWTPARPPSSTHPPFLRHTTVPLP